jgi:hypothetical protein
MMKIEQEENVKATKRDAIALKPSHGGGDFFLAAPCLLFLFCRFHPRPTLILKKGKKRAKFDVISCIASAERSERI